MNFRITKLKIIELKIIKLMIEMKVIQVKQLIIVFRKICKSSEHNEIQMLKTRTCYKSYKISHI